MSDGGNLGANTILCITYDVNAISAKQSTQQF